MRYALACVVACTLPCLLPAAARAQSAAPDADVRAELQQLRQRVADLEQADARNQSLIASLREDGRGHWLDQRRADEVRNLVHEVLADADARASLLADGMTAGIDDRGKVFLRSADDAFHLNIGGQLQLRYILNSEDDRSGANREIESGFQIRRAKLAFTGHIADPKFSYALGLQTSRNSGPNGGNTSTEYAYVRYTFDNGLSVAGGVMTLPFARQERVSSKRQTAVARAIVTEFFTLNFSEQLQLGYRDDLLNLAVAASDGANNDFTDFPNDQAHNFALTARADVKLAGDWKQMSDEIAWAGEDLAAFVGGAVHWESNGNTAGLDDWLAWTVDALVETGNLGLTAAVFGAHDSQDAVADRDALGAYVQGVYTINDTWAPFGRYEWLDGDSAATDPLQAVTVGLNYFLKKHNAKVTGDVVYLFAGDDPARLANTAGSEMSSSLGLVGGKTDDNDQLALRLQFQLLF